jgi:hypothetical protein
MHPEQKEFLGEHFAVKKWYGRGGSGRRVVKGFRIEGPEFKNWRLQRVKREEGAGTITLRSLWGHGESGEELLSVDVVECASVKAAHDQLLEMLADVQSPKVEQQTGKTAPGDVAFGLANTMILFARANLAVWIRNAGPRVVPVGVVARELDAQILRRLESE